MKATTLGPFQLITPLGRGGMGEVWLARRRPHGEEVAVKVLTSEAARNERYRRGFRREVQAMARLDHPHIALIIDRGVVDERASRASDGYFVAGSPFLAMEYIDGPTLGGLSGQLDWPQLRQILLQLLDALAHAHALDVVHRDLKPSNVMVESSADKLSVRLVDFGISAGFADEQPDPAGDRTTGTPKYMAPEQILGKRRDQGPWTDLYALGCVAWKLSCGEVPFAGPNEDILRAHLSESLPEFAPKMALPDGFRAWLQRMLAKHPGDRFRRAADAAHALLSLGPAPTTNPAASSEKLTAGPDEPTAQLYTLGVLPATIPVETATEITPRFDDQALSDRATDSPLQPQLPPLPPSWRVAEPRRRASRAGAASLGMYGLRIIPVVDRDPVRDALWEQLTEVVDRGETRVTLLRGETGSGKTRLARWLARRAHEIGAGDTLEASHSPLGSPTDGLVPMLARRLGCVGLAPKESFKRVRELYERLGAQGREAIVEPAAVTELIHELGNKPSDLDGTATYQFSSVQERYAIITGLLRRLAALRPLVIVLDDVQWGHEALGFVRHLLDTDADDALPAQVVATVQETSVDADARLCSLLDGLDSDARVASHTLGALAEADQSELVERLLRLDPALAAEVVARSGGNPMFAVETVGDWIMQDLLEPGPTGFRRRDETPADLPDDLNHLWRRRLDHFLDAFLDTLPAEARPGARMRLEIAAVLGGDVALEEWTEVCRREAVPQNIPQAERLLDALFEHGLARRTEGGWSLTSQVLVDVLEESARSEGRWRGYHQSCAETLEAMYPAHTRGLQRRLGEHFAAAGEDDRAFEALRLAIEQARDFGDHDQARALVQKRERLTEAAGLSADDRRRVQNWLLREKIDVRDGDFDVAAERVARALEVATRCGYTYEEGFALVEKGVLLSHTGERDDSLDCYRRATAIFEKLGHRDRLARALGELSVGYQANGQRQEAVAAMLRAAELFEQDANRSMLAQCQVHLGNLYAALGDFDQADHYLERALDITQKTGNQRLLGECYFYWGEVYRLKGELESARRCFLKSAAIYEPIDRHNPFLARLGAAIAEVQLENFARAEALFERLLRHFTHTGQTHYTCFALAGLTACAAHRHDWPAWDRHTHHLDEQLDSARVVDPALLTLADAAARLATQAGQHRRATFAAELADAQREALGEGL
ncbi:MAG: serine/threonine-protein kinase PknK [Persicimonas sp.]